MKLEFCDLCGGQIKNVFINEPTNRDLKDGQGRRVQLPSTGDHYGHDVWIFHAYDLCPVCIGSLAEWFEARKLVKVVSL